MRVKKGPVEKWEILCTLSDDRFLQRLYSKNSTQDQRLFSDIARLLTSKSEAISKTIAQLLTRKRKDIFYITTSLQV